MNIYQKLLEVKKNCNKLTKSNRNQYGGFNYYDIEELTAELKRLCVIHGLLTVEETHIARHMDLPTVQSSGAGPGHHFLTIVTVYNVENPEEKVRYRMASEPLKNKKMSAPQEAGSNQTYNKRYIYQNILGVDDGATDPDRLMGVDEDPRPKPKQTPPKQPKPKQTPPKQKKAAPPKQKERRRPHDDNPTDNYRKHFYKELKKTPLNFDEISAMTLDEQNYGKPADQLSVPQMKEVIEGLSQMYDDAGMEV